MSLFSSTLSVIVNGRIPNFFQRCQADRESYYQRIYAKTASLFETSATCAALISPVTEETIQIIRTFGYNIGMAFQIMDDVLDFISDPTKLGKPVGSDLRQGLITLPTLYYIEDHPEDQMVQQILEGHCPHYEEDIKNLVDRIRSSPAIDHSIAEAERYVNEAMNFLQKLPSCPEKTHLEELTLYITRREL